MRSGLVAALMGIGGIFLSFGATIFIISIFTKMNGWGNLAIAVRTGTWFVVGGAVMVVAGYLLNRIARNSGDRAPAKAGLSAHQ